MIKEAELNTLLKRNQAFAEHYKTSPLMQLINNPEMAQKKARECLLDCIQTFSNYFQKTVMLRYVFCDNLRFLNVIQEHLQEEFAHNFSLDADRNHRLPEWDAILEATAGWFTWKMFTLDQEEKTVLLHLVMETSANIFFQEAHKIMQKYSETNYFKIHSEADEKHEKMGIELLQNLSSEKYQRLLEIQYQGWDMLNAVCDRMATLTKHHVKKNAVVEYAT